MVDTFAASQTGTAQTIRVGDVLSRAFSLFGAQWAPFIGLALVAYAPDFIFGLLVPKPSGALTLVSLVLQTVCGALANAAIIYGVVQVLRGRGFTFSESIGSGFSRMGAVVGLSLLVGILVVLATLLLVVPGIIVWCVYAVAIPVCVVERLGPSASMSRSSFLTRGNRWRIFGIFALIIVASVVFGALFGALAAYVGGLVLVAVAVFLIQALAGAFNAVAVGVLYYQLRVAREGVDIENIASVFD
jgi:hypothetical protein